MIEDVDPSSGPARRGLSRAAMLGLIAVFVGPLLLAILMYTRLDSWQPSGQVNHGELITPARPLGEITLIGPDEARLETDYFRGKWTLVYLAGSRCDLGCETALFKTRQARETLGRDSDRVQRLYLVVDRPSQPWPPAFAAEHPLMQLATAPGASRAAVVDGFGADGRGRVFVVDPLGNVMMRYDAEATTKGIQKDLKRLLKVSQIG
jgi:cytochrome oxidase Cu insertion factor (SCO1/SenC/PrrC family)